ncbi:DUF853 domain-containing protein [Shewanella seohaensis]|uniref:DUF853 domain-containing protein n=1 Tax=Shewanella seohaensis TaxID=755175 RepID=UPI0021C7E7EE|nr:DUF853 domain-containing protein [Shewanella seohaensis]UXM82147.1 DUF853 domain-containing protein [Shewanella seohaensis]
MRLIRSKGVGVFCSQFLTIFLQREILGRLARRFSMPSGRHPKGSKAVKTAVETFVPNPKLVSAR